MVEIKKRQRRSSSSTTAIDKRLIAFSLLSVYLVFLASTRKGRQQFRPGLEAPQTIQKVVPAHHDDPTTQAAPIPPNAKKDRSSIAANELSLRGTQDPENVAVSPPTQENTEAAPTIQVPSSDAAVDSRAGALQAPPRPPLQIIILTMNRFDSLERLLKSLRDTDYGEDQVDLAIRFDRPKTPSDDWKTRVDTFHSSLSWEAGRATVTIAETNGGLRQAWLSAWRPQSNDERAIIFEDDITVSPLWYQWLMGAYEAYQHYPDLAGISLNRLKEPTAAVPDNGGLPFLYRLVDSIGFAPLAGKWLDFLDFAECALASNLDMNIPSLISSKWYYKMADQTTMWTQLFIFFSQYNNLYTLYAFPKDNTALAAHWREKGEHAKKTQGADFLTVDGATTTWRMDFPRNLTKLDWNAQPVPTVKKPRVRVLSAAVGYPSAEFDRFFSSLRSHYEGDVAILVYEMSDLEIFAKLKQYNVQVYKTSAAGGPKKSKEWKEVNRARWQFFQDACPPNEYDLCLTIDFRDALFQDDPFRDMEAGKPGEALMHLYEHNMIMNDFHLNRAVKCRGHNTGMEGKIIVNAGGFIGTPEIFPQMVWWQGLPKPCDDQVALNLGLYSGVFNATIITHRQGEGNINNVAWGAEFRRDSRGRFLNRNCFPSPVVHQFDLVEQEQSTNV